MKRQIAFILFSDIQVEDWKRYSENHSRLYHNGLALQKVAKAANKYGVPLLFAGDFFDNAKELSNRVITYTFKTYKKYLQHLKVFAISGNHDQCDMNTPSNASPSHLELYDIAFDDFYLLDHTGPKKHGNFLIHGIPYLKNNVGFEDEVKKAKMKANPSKKNILLVHTDFHGIAYNNQRSAGTVENLPRRLGKLFKGFDLVLSGHIHKPAVIRKNIVMAGATHHQRVSDIGVEMGYWLIYDDLSYKFIPLDLPQFKRGKPKADGNFWLPQPTKRKNKKLVATNAQAFVSADPRKLAKSYLKATNNKSKTKLKLLNRYLSHGLS